MHIENPSSDGSTKTGKEKANLERLQDLTDQMIAAGKIDPEDTVLNILLDVATDGYWDWFIEQEYEYMSPRFKEILGYEDYEVPNHPQWWMDNIHPDDLPIALNNFEKHIETLGDYPFYQEVRYYHKDGSVVWILCRGKVISWDSEGKPLRMVGTHTDITRIKRVEQSANNERA